VLIDRYDKGRRCTAHHAPSSLLARFTRLVILWNLPLRIQQNIDEALDTSKCSTSLIPFTYNSPPKIFASLYHTLDVGFEHARCWEDELKNKIKKETWKQHSETGSRPLDCLQPHIFCAGNNRQSSLGHTEQNMDRTQLQDARRSVARIQPHYFVCRYGTPFNLSQGPRVR
jgi:hypothetical protein